ncbi:hypothetical protein LZ009_05170 [Ramlibacter sp. XY19]|uniref:hypothetical protein n=1 Tax=Ramlibacter paludis TaxID=2908000 RepID=UPI0023DA4165|nr:hypothetical protein [Ramlibacter paludis]MCG2592167.1 hypothetical protein [Ramlibacter paludis]
MSEAAYRIIDEPAPSRWSHLAVDPLWPMFAYMFGGTWLSWTWFVVNGHAIGSPTRWRETALVVAGFAGSFALAMGLGWAIGAGYIPREQTWLAILAVTLWKMGMTYWIFVLQARTVELFKYFGGQVRSGILVVAAGFFLRGKVMALMPNGLWMVVLS